MPHLEVPNVIKNFVKYCIWSQVWYTSAPRKLHPCLWRNVQSCVYLLVHSSRKSVQTWLVNWVEYWRTRKLWFFNGKIRTNQTKMISARAIWHASFLHFEGIILVFCVCLRVFCIKRPDNWKNMRQNHGKDEPIGGNFTQWGYLLHGQRSITQELSSWHFYLQTRIGEKYDTVSLGTHFFLHRAQLVTAA